VLYTAGTGALCKYRMVFKQQTESVRIGPFLLDWLDGGNPFPPIQIVEAYQLRQPCSLYLNARWARIVNTLRELNSEEFVSPGGFAGLGMCFTN
jgi:hypothetical protein